MRINKGVYLFIILLLASTIGMAQMSLSFSPIAFSKSGVTASGGSPIIIQGKNNCVTVGSGLSALTIAYNNKGEYGVACKEIPPVAHVSNVSVSLKLYPNPTNGPATLKCEGQFDANLSCELRIISLDGKMMMSQMVLMKDVQAGYMINAAAYAAGIYVVSLDFMNQRYNLKLIKL